jgi:hypothetical protein
LGLPPWAPSPFPRTITVLGVEPEDEDDDKYSKLAREWQSKLLASEGEPADRRRVYAEQLKDDQDEMARLLAAVEPNPKRFGQLKTWISIFKIFISNRGRKQL